MSDSRLTAVQRAQEAAASQSADSHDSVLADFGRSLVYSATQRPLDGLLEGFDHVTGAHTVDCVSFMKAPEPAKLFSPQWYAETAGGMLGSLVPLSASFAIATKLGGGMRASGEITGLLPRLVGSNADALMIGRSALAGGVMEGVFNPIGDSHENYWTSRATSGLAGAAIFGGLGAATVGLNSMRELKAAAMPDEAAASATVRPELGRPAIPPPADGFSIASMLSDDPELDGHATAFSLIKQEHPADFRGLTSAGADFLAHGGDSLVIDLGPGRFVDDTGATYDQAVLKIMEVRDRAVPGQAWQTPEWDASYGRRGGVDLPLVRTAGGGSTTDVKEAYVGGRTYYAFMQPKGLAFGSEYGDQTFAELESDPAYLQWEKNMHDAGFEWKDKKPGQIVKYNVTELGEDGAPHVVQRYGLADYPAIGPAEIIADSPVDSVRSSPIRSGADESFEPDELEHEPAPRSESEQLSDAGMHVLEAPPVDPRWHELAQTVRDYVEGGVRRKDIEQTLQILYPDYLEQTGMTAKQAIFEALKQKG